MEASSQPMRTGQRRSPHSSPRPGKPATRRRAAGDRRTTRQLTGADLKWEALKVKVEWMTTRGVTPGEEGRSLESPVR
jgi:hypothetical protein